MQIEINLYDYQTSLLLVYGNKFGCNIISVIVNPWIINIKINYYINVFVLLLIIIYFLNYINSKIIMNK